MKKMIQGVAVLALVAGSMMGCVTWTPGQYDREVLGQLNASLRDLHLRRTLVKDVAPEYHVERGQDLTWEEALSKANQSFAGDTDRRALFLAKFIKEGDPAERITELGLPDMGSYCGQGSGYSVSYGLGIPKEEQIPYEDLPRGPFPMHPPSKLAPLFRSTVRAVIGFYLSYNGTVLSPQRLCIHDVAVKGIRYAELVFDMDNKLEGFSRRVEPHSGVTLTLGGNTSGEGETDFFHASVSLNGRERESLQFAPDLKIKRRWVYDPATHGADHVDIYKDGKAVMRHYYKSIQTHDGTQTVIDRSEKLDQPRP